MSRTSQTLLRLGVPTLAAATMLGGVPAFLGTASANHIGTPVITPVPSGDNTAAAGSCKPFFIDVPATSANTSGTTVGETINVVLTDTSATATSNVSFCTLPQYGVTPQAGTQISSGATSDQSEFTLGASGTSTAGTGRATIGITRDAASGSTPVSIQAYYDVNNDNAFTAGEPQQTSQATFTAGGTDFNTNQDAAASVEVISSQDQTATPATSTATTDRDRAVEGETRTYRVLVLNAAGDPLRNVTVNRTVNSNTTVAQGTAGDQGSAVFGQTNNDGIVTGTVTFPAISGDDDTQSVVEFFVNQTGNERSNGNRDTILAGGGVNEPFDTLTVTVEDDSTQQNRTVDLTVLEDRTRDVNTENSSEDATNSTRDQDRVFRAVVDDPRTGVAADLSSAGTFLAFTVAGGSGDEFAQALNNTQTTDGMRNECTTVAFGSDTDTNNSFCDVRVVDPTPTSGQTLTVTASVRATSVSDSGTLAIRNEPQDARNIAVTPDSGQTLSQGVAVFTARVTDAAGLPVQGVVVNFTESGTGRIRSNPNPITNAQGVAIVETTTEVNEFGEQTVTGTIQQNQNVGRNDGIDDQATFTACNQTSAGNCSDTGKTTFVATLASPSPSATASATPTATASGTPSPTATATVPGAPQCATPLRVTTSRDFIIPTIAVTVTVTGAAPGALVDLQAYSRPNDQFRSVRTTQANESGTITFDVLPGTNTRLYAQCVNEEGGAGQAGSVSNQRVINVRTALSLSVVRNGRRDYTFQGRILPRRADQLITLYRVESDGTRVITSQLKTDATGTYRFRRVFTGSGTFGFLARTGQTLTNAAGESTSAERQRSAEYLSTGRGTPRPTAIF